MKILAFDDASSRQRHHFSAMSLGIIRQFSEGHSTQVSSDCLIACAASAPSIISDVISDVLKYDRHPLADAFPQP